MNKSTNSGTNLAWFSYVPYWSSVSTIFSMEMMPSLAKIYDVTVWTLQSEWRSFSNTTNEFKIRQLVSGNDLWLELNQSQVFVYCAFDLPFESNDFLIATAQGYPGLLIVNRKKLQEWARDPRFSAILELNQLVVTEDEMLNLSKSKFLRKIEGLLEQSSLLQRKVARKILGKTLSHLGPEIFSINGFCKVLLELDRIKPFF
jgi:hypothetical protein